MTTLLQSFAPINRFKPLAACVASLLGFSGHSAIAATTHFVLNCDDAGADSLRAVIGDAATVSGDTVDLSLLVCSSISLTTGAIIVPQNDLNIVGPASHIAVFGNNDRLFKHNGTGTLAFEYLDMGAGTFASAAAAYGGCIYSKGSVNLKHSSLSSCYAHSTGAKAGGGAVKAVAGVGLDHTEVVGSVAKSNTSTAHGGGIIAGGFQSKYSTVSGNKAVGFTTSTGGGVYIVGTTSMNHTTISGNSAGFLAGGMLQQGGASFTMTSSTISGNDVTHGVIGGLAVVGPPTSTIDNSTIAFNTASFASFNAKVYAPGLAILTSGTDMTVKMRSTLVSNNSYGGYDFDLSQNPGGGFTITFEPSSNSNLFRVPGNGTLPADTILFACPDLGRLRNNGGATQTHALNTNSIAIDNGSNPNSFTHDQRGVAEDTTLYPRVSNGVADIGAYEVNQADIIFTTAFEACRPLIAKAPPTP